MEKVRLQIRMRMWHKLPSVLISEANAYIRGYNIEDITGKIIERGTGF